MSEEDKTKKFYDEYWPQNIPDYNKTQAHIHNLLPEKALNIALDAGCGAGVCSLALSITADKVVSCDLSRQSLKAASLLKDSLNKKNINFINANLLNLPFKDNSVDLALSWGVIHHTVNPHKAILELIRVLKRGGYLIVAVYIRTELTFLHEFARRRCLGMRNKFIKSLFIKSVACIVRILEMFGKKTNVRDDNVRIESQVEDWFFVPVKHFFKTDGLKRIFEENNLTFEILCGQTGRLKSSSNIIARGVKR